jgi:hypothetical protein
MCSCITPQALLSALVGRAARDGQEPTAADLRAVLKLGCTREEIAARFEQAGGAASERALALLAEIPR